jgi:hypothetical protein
MGWWQRVSEQILPAWGPWGFSGLRSRFKVEGGSFFGNGPRYENTVIGYDNARALYSNISADKNLGAFFAKPIVDLQVDFIGHPTASTDQEELDDFLNACLHDYWADVLHQTFRNAIRDSHTFVRIQQDEIAKNPLLTSEEAEHCRLEVVNPERVTVVREDPNSRVMTEVIIKHEIEFLEEPPDFVNGVMPKYKKHEVLEIITAENFRYYDTTDRVELTEWNMDNIWGFIPLVEVFNEFDSTLNGGQSDLEQVWPLIHAFHDVMHQGLQAHKYHSIPKVKLKLQDVQPFLKNNFPNVLDENGKIAANATVTWKGKEIIFLQAEEDAEFLEARSVLGDTKQLGDFLVDLICIASGTPRWAFMDVEAGSANQANNAQTLPWAKKILRKRKMYQETIQELLKMVMVITNESPVRPKLTWEIIRVEDQVAHNQALQMLVMGLEVAAQRKIISDATYREMLRQFIPNMKNPSQEEKDAEDNFEPAIAETNGFGNPENVPVTAGKQGKNE